MSDYEFLRESFFSHLTGHDIEHKKYKTFFDTIGKMWINHILSKRLYKMTNGSIAKQLDIEIVRYGNTFAIDSIIMDDLRGQKENFLTTLFDHRRDKKICNKTLKLVSGLYKNMLENMDFSRIHIILDIISPYNIKVTFDYDEVLGDDIPETSYYI